jgi:hypothetical protein
MVAPFIMAYSDRSTEDFHYRAESTVESTNWKASFVQSSPTVSPPIRG